MLTDIEYLIINVFLNTEKEYRPSEIREICKLTEPTLHKYLNKLSEEKYLSKRLSRRKGEYPHPVFYILNNNIETFQKLITEVIETPYWLKFYSSTYCQNNINQELVKKIKADWKYPQDSDKVKKYPNLSKDGTFIGKIPNYLSDKETEFILSASPTALKEALNCQWKSEEYFVWLMLMSFIKDGSRSHIRPLIFNAELHLNVISPIKMDKKISSSIAHI